MRTKQGEEIPPLDGLAYKAQKFIDTGSKMSDILLALDRSNRPVALKIACVDQRARADVNRLAIRNTIEWLSKLGGYRGIIGLRSIDFTKVARWRSWLVPPIYCALLRHWPGQPEFLVMEHITGGSLRDFVGDKRLTLELALWIAHYIARALAYIHQRGCVHRDIKPENILFRALPQTGSNQANTRPILIDFGVAAQIGAVRLVSGSRLWMAPELQDAYERRALTVDPSWDMYALGLILCYMLTGRRPRHKNYEIQDYETFREQTFAVLDRGNAETSSALQAAKVRVKQLIAKTLDKNLENRPTAQAFATETAALLACLGMPLPAYERWLMRLEQHSRLPSINRPWLSVAGILLLVLALLVWTGFAARRGQFFVGFAAPARATSGHRVATPEPALAVARVAQVGLFTTTNAATLAEPSLPAIGAQSTPTQPPTFTSTTLPPTLVPFTPDMRAAIPTLIPFTELPITATVTISPQIFTPTPTQNPLLGSVQLLSPAAGIHSSVAKVTFIWAFIDQPLAADQCFALVFWEPNNAADKRSPRGAGKVPEGRVDFNLLASDKDLLLRKLAQTRQEFNWGVRLVSCATPKNILKEAEQVRAYTYDSQ